MSKIEIEMSPEEQAFVRWLTDVWAEGVNISGQLLDAGPAAFKLMSTFLGFRAGASYVSDFGTLKVVVKSNIDAGLVRLADWGKSYRMIDVEHEENGSIPESWV